jgi:diguanylate cyclase (GGDEF)-like protein
MSFMRLARGPRPPWARTAVWMVLLLVVYAGWQVFRWPHISRELVGDAFFYPVGVVAIWTSLAAARRCRPTPRLRTAWRLLALASTFYLAGDVAQTVYEAQGQVPYPSIADALYLLFYPVMLVGLLRVPVRSGGRSERIRLGLDLALVAIGGAAAVVYVVLGPTVVQSGPDVLQTAISIAYPVGDMVLLVGLAAVLIRRTAPSGLRAFQFMAGGLVFFVAADLVYGWITLHSIYHGGDPVDTLWMVAIALFAVAGSAQTAPDPGREEPADVAPRRASWAPYVAVGVGYGILLFNERHARLLPDGAILIASVLLTALVSIRQFLAQRDLVATQGQLSHQSLHDSLTGLPNRMLIIDRAEQMLLRARRTETPVAALYVDVDGFKRVNDSFGHATGDDLLREVGSRLLGVTRSSDTVGRLGGDEFIVLLETFGSNTVPEIVADRICEALARPFHSTLDGSRTLAVTASVGVAVTLEGSSDELMRDADLALYAAKRSGKNRWMRFESGMHSAAQERLDLEIDLIAALGSDQLFLVYQPLVDLSTERITGVEALLRWRHPERGLIPPGIFVELAESCGLIAEIGRWVLNAACRQGADWHRRGRPVGIAVNVSAVQLGSAGLVDDVARALADSGLDPRTLTLEITETTLMRDAEAAARQLRELKVLGVRIAIDDFGTGYSSLAYLGQFPVDSLKIDRSFVSGIARSPESRVLIHAVVGLGKALALETVAEGIEEDSELRFLQKEGCDSGQGYLFARPLEAAAIEERLTPGAGAEPRANGVAAPPSTPRTPAAPRRLPAGSTRR